MNKVCDKYSYEELKAICKQCFSYRQFALRLGLSENSTDTVKSLIKRYNLDNSHFKGQGWNRDNVDISLFQYNKAVKSDVLLRALTILRGWKCEKCGREKWENERIPLCIHHLDGNHINNEINNLQVLCPNCHAQTDNYCGKNNKKCKKYSDELFVEALKESTSIRQALQKIGINYAAKYYYDKAHYLMDKYNIVFQKKTKKQKIKPKEKQGHCCIDCGKKISDSAKRCVECEHKRHRKAEWPTRDELKQLIRTKSFLSIAKQFEVTDNTIRNWCKKYKLPFKKSEIKQYTEEEWLTI